MIHIEKTPYAGWPNAYRLANASVELIITGDVGPRIVAFGFAGEENEFHQIPDDLGKTGGDTWRIYGGHRFWYAPETLDRTYFPDNSPIQVDALPDGLRLVQPVEPVTGMRKTIEIRLPSDEPVVRLRHLLTNTGPTAIQAAPWALTVLHAGGVAILPHPPRSHWPEPLLPSHTLTLWGYTRMADPHWTWGDRFILFRPDEQLSEPQKVGMWNTTGWMAYARAGKLFVKHFAAPGEGDYPDLNCNTEMWANNQSLELETLGPLRCLQPAESVDHEEVWSLLRDVPPPASDADVEQFVLPALGRT